MNTHTTRFHTSTLWACLALVVFGGWETPAIADRSVERWGVFELVLDGPDRETAYMDVSIAATFQSDGEMVKVPGFYDGAGQYKVRFSPSTLGPWTFSTESNQEQLASKSGSFECIPPSPNNHGPVQAVNTFYLQYADGTPYYAVGTTAYQWTSVDQRVQEKTLATLASAPFNKIRMCVFPKWYRHGNDTEPWAYPFQRNGDQNDFTRPNYAFFRNLDLRVRQLAEMGIQADVILFHSYDKWGYAQMGSEQDDRYLRYMIARLSAYRNVWWSMANEYDLMIHNKEKTRADFDRFFQICQKEDPHQRLRGNHNWYYSEDHFYDHSHPWVTHASLQTYHFWNLLKWREQYQKPVLIDEMRYEGDVSSSWGNLTADEMTSYFWMAGLCGAYPTHGDTFDNRAGGGETRWWGKGGTLPGKSIPRIAFFKGIMEQAPVTEMTPAITIEGEGSTETLNDNVHVFAKPGEYYLAYVAKGGKTIRLDLPGGTPYAVELIDTRKMTIKPLADTAPGEFTFVTPTDYSALRVIARPGNPGAGATAGAATLSFRDWLFAYIPARYPDARMTDHTHWLQAHISDDLVASWTEWTDEDSTLKAMESHGLNPGEALFIEQKGRKKEWADHPAVTFYKGAGYYISGYDSATMSTWDGKGLSVIQFDGDAEALAKIIANAWVATAKVPSGRQESTRQPFRQWLFEYVPEEYPDARMTDHGAWLQAHVTEDLVASWTQWNEQDVTLQYLEGHGLRDGKAIFIERGDKTDWADHAAVTYIPGAGYYCSGYDSTTMRDWGVEGCNIVQFDGDSRAFAETMATARGEVKPDVISAKRPAKASAPTPVLKAATPARDAFTASSTLRVTTEKLDGINTFKVKTAMGTFHWECDPGKSGWMSAFDNNGKDWITAGPKQRGVGVNSQFRGLPNSGADDWGHPSRNWDHAMENVTSRIVVPTSPDRVLIESGGNTITARWHCFDTHIAMEILELKSGKYHFLWEGTPGGTIHTEQGVVTADGATRKIQEGWFADTPDWPAGKHGEWFYILDPNKKFNMWMAQTPATNDKGELWYQGGNMDLASFGRPDNKPTFSDTDRTFVWGFMPYAWDFQTAQNHIETILANPLEKKTTVAAAPGQLKSKRLRVIMMSDFPPINVVKGGDVPNNQKSDPDDMQSIVRFLLYANEFDVEGLIAAAGTFAMEAHKKHMLDVLDRYELVYANLKSHDPAYPTPDDLRSVTYEGLGNNHGLSIKWGSKSQPVSDIIGEGKDSEASNAIIAAADKPDPRPLWIGVWGTPREVSQAVWRVRNDRSEAEFNAFISKLRIFLIAYQDCTHSWLMNEFPDLFIIDSRKTYQGMFGGRDPLSNLAWVNENIRNDHGPLCALYPHEGMGCTGVCEGDSPTFLYLVSANRGINDPEDPTQPSWGGQYKHKPDTRHYVDGPGGSSIAKWRKDYQEEFAERADWCVEPAPAVAPASTPVAKPHAAAVPVDPLPVPSAASSSVVFAVNCGGAAYTSADGTDYIADTGYAGGLTYSNTESIEGTEDDPLYHSERYGDCTYAATVPNGRYRVTLHFAETFHPQEGLRDFRVRMEGTERLQGLDLYAKAGANAAYITDTDVTVRDGELTIEFVTDFENAKINAIKVSRLEPGVASNNPSVLPLPDRAGSPPKVRSVQSNVPGSPPTLNLAMGPARTAHKPRIINTTDLGADPDDEQSMVRQLVCANEFDIEGLIVSTGCWKKNQSHTGMLDKILNAYGEVVDNLSVHAEGFPSLEYLRSVSVLGQRGYGMSDVGTGKDSPGSELIIASVDRDDPRPVWVMGWGGVNNVAQAVWKVRETRSPEALDKFLSKLRVFDILGQDDAGAWLAKTFPNLFYIRATGVYGWQPPKNGPYQRNDIQSHGPLGAVYPDTKWATEGDTPAFMHVYPNGLNDPDQIDQGGWGGRFSFQKKAGIRSMSGVTKIRKDGETRFDPYYMYGNTSEKAAAIKRWSKGYNNDFAARMDWSVTREYADANHHPIAVVNGDTSRQVLNVSTAPGASVELNAAGSSDPDGDELNYAWSFYKEPSSYGGDVEIQQGSSSSAIVTVPSDAGGKNIHLILELYDNGSPNLYAYRRVIINVQ